MVVKTLLIVLIVLLAVVTGALTWQIRGSFAAGDGIRESVRSEAESIRQGVDGRCDELEKKLDRIEGKIDRLIDMLTPKLPDGMKTAPGSAQE